MELDSVESVVRRMQDDEQKGISAPATPKEPETPQITGGSAPPPAVTPPLSPTTQEDPVRSVVKRMMQDQSSRASMVDASNMNTNPETASQAQEVGKHFGLPAEAVEPNLEAFKQRAELEKNNKIFQDNPGVARWAAEDPSGARIARDSFDSLAWYEKPIATMIAPYGVVEQAKLGRAAVGLEEARRMGTDTSGPLKTINEAEGESEVYQTYEPTGGYKVAGKALGFIYGLIDSATEALPVAGAAAATAGVGGAVAGGAVGGPVGAATGGLAGLLTGASTGATIGIAADFAKSTAGNIYWGLEHVRNKDGQPMPESSKRVAMSIGAGVMGVIGLYGLGAGKEIAKEAAESFTKDYVKSLIAKQGFVSSVGALSKSVGKGVGQGAVMGMLMSAGQTVGVEAAKKMSPGEWATVFNDPKLRKEAIDQMVESTVDMAALMGVTHGAGTLLRQYGEARQSHRDAAMFEELAGKAEKDPVRKRSPSTFESFFQSQAGGTPVENIYVPASKIEEFYTKSGVVPGAKDGLFGKILPDIAEQLAAAKGMNGDVKIPTSKYISHLVGTEMDKALRADIRVREDGMSVNDMKDHQEKVQQILKDMTAQMKEEGSAEHPGNKIAADMREQIKLAGGGGLSPAEANKVANLHAARYVALGEKLGIDPYELHKKTNLKIISGEEETPAVPGETMLGQAPPANTLYQSHDKTKSLYDVGFHSRMYNHIADKFDSEATAEKYLKQIEEGVKSGKFKEDEVKWSFVRDFLNSRKSLGGGEEHRERIETLQREVARADQLLKKKTREGTDQITGEARDKLVAQSEEQGKELAKEREALKELERGRNAPVEKITKQELLDWIKENRLKIVERTYTKRTERVKVPIKKGKRNASDTGFDRSDYPMWDDVEWSDAEKQEPDPDYVSQEVDYYAERFEEDEDPEKWFKDGNSRDLVKATHLDENDEPTDATEYEWDHDRVVDLPSVQDSAYESARENADYHMSATLGDRSYNVYFNPENDSAYISYNDRHGRMRDLEFRGRVNEENIRSVIEEHMREEGIIYDEDQVNEIEDEWNKEQEEKSREAAEAAGVPHVADIPAGEPVTPEQAEGLLKVGEMGVTVVFDFGKKSFYTEFDIPALNDYLRQGNFGEQKIIPFENKDEPITVDPETARAALEKGYRVFLMQPGVESRGLPEKLPITSVADLDQSLKVVRDEDHFVIFPKHAEVEGVHFRYENRDVGFINWDKSTSYKFKEGGPIVEEGEKTIELPSIRGPGGHNFRDAGSIMMHLRYNVRIAPNGERVLFIEEIQSDWHQAGREKGYTDKDNISKIRALQDKEHDLRQSHHALVNTLEGKTVAEADVVREKLVEIEKERQAVNDELTKLTRAVADAPLSSVNDYTAAAVKRFRLLALEMGVDRVAWTTGEQQAERWAGAHLRNVKTVRVLGKEGDSFRLGVFGDHGDLSEWIGENIKGAKKIENGGGVMIPATEVEALFGKDAAKEMDDRLNAPPREKITELPEGVVVEKMQPDMAGKVWWKALKKTEDGLSTYHGPGISENYGRLSNQEHTGNNKHDVTESVLEGLNAEDEKAHNEVKLQNVKITSKGMREVYNRIMVNVTNNMLKPYGSKVDVVDIDTGGKEPTKQWSYPITDIMRAETEPKEYLFQRGNRGAITFQDTQTIINLFKMKADRSTLLHELGHLYLKELHGYAMEMGAPESLRKDWDTIAKHIGYSGEGPISVESHEKFARSFETYLMEGKAPSPSLRSAFRSFKKWFKEIYKKIEALDAPISDDVRKVFDRMLATDEEIARTAKSQSADKLFKTPKDAGMTDEQFAKYNEIANNAEEAAKEQLLAEALEDIKAEDGAEWRAEEKKIRPGILAAVRARPAVRAMDFFKTGKLRGEDGTEIELGSAKLNREELAAVDPAAEASLPKSIEVTDMPGLSPDEAASLLGYPDGKTFLKDMADMKKTEEDAGQQKIENFLTDKEVEAKLSEQFSVSDEELHAKAEEIVGNATRLDLKLAELRALSRKAGKPVLFTRENVKAWADEQSATTPIETSRNIFKYVRAAAKNGRDATKAVLKGDDAAAIQALQHQVLNMALAERARKAKVLYERAIRLFDKTASKPTIDSTSQPYLDQVHSLLGRFGFSVNRNPKELHDALGGDNQITLDKFLEAKRGELKDIYAPEFLLSGAWYDIEAMTTDQFKALYDTVKSLLHNGREEMDLVILGQKIARAEARKRAVGQRRPGEIPVSELDEDPSGYGTTSLEKLGKGMTKLKASLRRVYHMCRVLDNLQPTGFYRDALFNNFHLSAGEETEMQAIEGKAWKEFTATLPKKWNRFLNRKFSSADMVYPDKDPLTGAPHPRAGQRRIFNGNQILDMATYLGSDSNMTKMLRGEGFTEEAVRRLLDDNLGEHEWRYVQFVLDRFNSYWDRTVELYKEQNGIAPTEIEAKPIPTKFGVLRGGYRPMVVDPLRARRATDIISIPDEGAIGRGFASGMTSSSRSLSRTEAAYPIRFDINMVLPKINEAIHDLAFRKTLINANKLITDPVIAREIRERLGVDAYDQFVGYIRDIAQPYRLLDKTMAGAHALNNYLYGHAMNGAIAWRATTADKHLVTTFWRNFSTDTPAEWVFHGYKKYLSTGMASRDYMKSKSKFAKYRMDQVYAEQQREFGAMTGKSSRNKFVDFMGHWLIGMSDIITAAPLWIGTHDYALSLGHPPERAIQMADDAVMLAHGGARNVDRAAFYRTRDTGYRWLGVLGNLMNSAYNVTADEMVRVKMGNEKRRMGLPGARKDYTTAAINTLFAVVLPGISIGKSISFIKGELSGDDTDEDTPEVVKKYLREAGEGVLEEIAGFFPAGRSATDAVKYAGHGGALSSLSGKMLESTASAIHDWYKMLDPDADTPSKIVEHTLNAAGYTGLLPGAGGVPAQAAQYLWDLWEEKVDSPEDTVDFLQHLLMGKKKK